MADYPPIQHPEEIVLKDSRDDVQKILGYPPNWALRWGITAIAIAMVGFLVLAWIVKYPDIIEARAVILTENPPIRIVSLSSGKITQLLVKDKDQVDKGQLLAVLENPADLAQVDSLERLLQELEHRASPDDWIDLPLPILHELGTLQPTYATLQQAVNNFSFYARQKGIYAQMKSLRAQINHLKALNQALQQQQKTYEEEVALAKKNVERNEGLRKMNAISAVELETVRKAVFTNAPSGRKPAKPDPE